jgi:hypothetical protein
MRATAGRFAASLFALWLIPDRHGQGASLQVRADYGFGSHSEDPRLGCLRLFD